MVIVNELLLYFVVQFIKKSPPESLKKHSLKVLQNFTQKHWDRFFHLASLHGVDMLLFHRLTENNCKEWDIPEKQRQRFKKLWVVNLSHSLILSNELKKVLQTLETERINALVLKGASMAQNYYPLPELRPFNDIDILVQKKDLDKIKDTLIKSGYTSQEKSKENFNRKYWYCLPFFQKKKKILLEIHWNIAQLKRYKININNIWQEATSFNIGKSAYLMMSIEDLIIYQSLHLAYHYYDRLLWMVDIALIIEKEKKYIDWEKIVKKCYAQNCRSPVYYALVYIKDLFKAPIPSATLSRLMPNLFIDYFVKLMLNTKELPGKKIIHNRFFRYPFALLMIDRMQDRVVFGTEFIRNVCKKEYI